MKPEPKIKVCMLSTMYLRYRNDTRGLMVFETNRNLLKQGIDVSVVAPNDQGCKSFEVMDGVQIYRFSYFLPKKLQKLAYGSGIPTNLRKSVLAKLQIVPFFLAFLMKTIKVSRKCDIIHCQWIASGFIGLLAGKFTKKPVVVTVRRVGRRGIMKMINRYVLKRADYVIFNSSYTQKESLKTARPETYSVIHNSIDTDKFRPMKTDLKKELGIEGKKMIFSMGLLVEKKGFDYLLKAMPEVLKENKDAVLVIAGGGEQEKELKALSKELGIDDHVKFVGTVSAEKTPEYYNASDLFVLASIVDSKGETETLGVVLMEALACGKPVVTTDVGGIPDVVSEECGYLVRPKDPGKLSEKINLLLSDKKKAENMGSKGRKRMLKFFDWERSGNSTMEAYKKVLDKQKPKLR
ncbi:glycosyltransferase [Candidatus Woesearchaeota archaeon]|nr:glycosyltransferase [Candidatus Woesearchaeota archaeon]